MCFTKYAMSLASSYGKTSCSGAAIILVSIGEIETFSQNFRYSYLQLKSAYPEIRKSIQEECIAQVKRLRHHPSLVIYAGNNEDYQVQEQYGLTYDYADKNPDNWLKTDFPTRYIYEKVLTSSLRHDFS